MAISKRISRATACILASMMLSLSVCAICLPRIAYADSGNTQGQIEQCVDMSILGLGTEAKSIAPGGELNVEVRLPAGSAEGADALTATIEYDASVWEPLVESDIKCVSPWTSAAYNPENCKLALVRIGEARDGQPICRFKLRALSSAAPGKTQVSLKEVTTSAGEADVNAAAVTHSATIICKSGNAATASNAAGKPDSSIDADTGTEPASSAVGADEEQDSDIDEQALASTGDSNPAPLIWCVGFIALIVAAASLRKMLKDERISVKPGLLSVSIAVVAGLASMGISVPSAHAIGKDIDGNGRIDMADVRLVEDMLVGLCDEDASADLNGDGAVSVTDLSLLLKGIDLTAPGNGDGTDNGSGGGANSGGNTTSPSNPGDGNADPINPGGDSPSNPGDGNGPAPTDSPSTPTTPSDGNNHTTPGNDQPYDPDIDDPTPTSPTPDDPGSNDPAAAPDDPGTSPSEPAEPVITVPDTAFRGLTFTQVTPTNDPVTYKPLIMQNELMKSYGTTGAGSQWPVSLETSASGSLMLYGIDVAGAYKSTDHGKTWSRANSGIDARGVGMFAIDPRNESHVLALGLGVDRTVGGIYRSDNAAQTWHQTFAIATEGSRYLWDGLEFDPTSFDPSQGICTDAYFSVPYDRDCTRRNRPDTKPDKVNNLTAERAGLYVTRDGGNTFMLLVNDRKLADGIVRITSSGSVFVGNQHGLFRVNADGTCKAFAEFANDGDAEYARGVTGLDVVGDVIYAQTWDGIYTVSGDAVKLITNSSYMSSNWPQFLSVSKSNPRHMVYMYRSDVNNYYVSRTHVSNDGGQTWTEASFAINSSFYRASWNGREKTFVIDPSDDSRIVSFGSDSLVVSEDGGASFIQANGISNMMLGGRLNFNVYSPDTYLMAAQDYAGAYTHDGGRTFEPVENLGKGNMYGGFAADDYTFLGFAGAKWGTGSLTVSHDGGGTWQDTGLELDGGSFNSMQSPSNPDVLFAGNYYSKDRGYTWTKMTNCVTVHAYNYEGRRELYGANSSGNVVVSYDNGDTWTNVTTGNISGRSSTTKENIIDMSLDQVNMWLYIVVGLASGGNTDQMVVRLDLNTLQAKKLDVPLDRSIGWAALKAIEVDPNSVGVVYACMSGGYFCAPTALVRSVDHGETWSVLTTSNWDKYPSNATNQGGYEVSDIEVDPYTGNAFVSGGCYGSWVIAPPYDERLLRHVKPNTHTVKYVCNGELVHTAQVANNDKHNYRLSVDGVELVEWYRDKDMTQPFPNGSYVYESMVLYAKVKGSHTATLMSQGKVFMQVDADKYDAGDERFIPTRDGYAFAGWFADEELTQPADFGNANGDIVAYAGWYKIVKDVFDPLANETHNYIAYADWKVQDMGTLASSDYANNRSLLLNVDKNSHYCITFKMASRFRVGMRTTTIWPYNPVTTCYIDPHDINGNDPVNEYVTKLVSTGDNIRMMITYYNYKCGIPYQEVKDTIEIYKVETDVPVL